MPACGYPSERVLKSLEWRRCGILRARRDLLRNLTQRSPIGSQLSSTALHLRKLAPQSLSSVNAKEQSGVHARSKDGVFYLRTEELEVAIRADPPANAHLRRDRISAKGSFFLYLAAAEAHQAIASLCPPYEPFRGREDLARFHRHPFLLRLQSHCSTHLKAHRRGKRRVGTDGMQKITPGRARQIRDHVFGENLMR